MTGRSDQARAGTRLGGYQVTHPVSGRGVGTVYRAIDIDTGEAVAIKEFLPPIARRDAMGRVRTPPELRDAYRFGLRCFLREAETLAGIDHQAVVDVIDIFERQGTAYLVMPFHDGETLGDLLEGPGRPAEEELRGWLMPVLFGLGAVHRAGSLHLNLRPDTIALTAERRPVLLGFSLTRTALRRRLRRDPAEVATDRYAAIELSTASDPADPATDLYALAALLYHAVTGAPPVHAAARLRRAPMPSAQEAAGGTYSADLLRFIDSGLGLHLEDRPTGVEQWARLLIREA